MIQPTYIHDTTNIENTFCATPQYYITTSLIHLLFKINLNFVGWFENKFLKRQTDPTLRWVGYCTEEINFENIFLVHFLNKKTQKTVHPLKKFKYRPYLPFALSFLAQLGFFYA